MALGILYSSFCLGAMSASLFSTHYYNCSRCNYVFVGNVCHNGGRRACYYWLLNRFAGWQQDRHLVQGDHNASPDVVSTLREWLPRCQSLCSRSI